MPAQNTATSFGSVTRTLHWLTALLILTAIPLGLIANQLPAYLAEVQPRRAAELSKTRTLVTQRLESERERLALESAA